MYSITDYDFDLPESLIAHSPREKRDESRLLCLDRRNGAMEHRIFSDISGYLNEGDVLVMNDTRVIPARLFGSKDSGGKAEILILDYPGGMARLARSGYFQCPCLVKASKRPKPGSFIRFGEDLKAEVMSFEDGVNELRFHCRGDFETVLAEKGAMPLPPYIKREKDDPLSEKDRETYQTVYAREKGAVAAPTAGLHFTAGLLEDIRGKGVETVTLTLHVGYGTFVPVRVNDIRDHDIHSERFHMPEDSAEKLNRAMEQNRRIIAVGTTSVRTLEYLYGKHGMIEPGPGTCDLFIYPGYTFKVVGAMITNFHIPQSTLLMLVSAFAGMETVKNAYRTAVSRGYRFYSFGDSMFIHG
jgi:S-adenosylmethionine:tRNA ribosyltransferase-isomerase